MRAPVKFLFFGKAESEKTMMRAGDMNPNDTKITKRKQTKAKP